MSCQSATSVQRSPALPTLACPLTEVPGHVDSSSTVVISGSALLSLCQHKTPVAEGRDTLHGKIYLLWGGLVALSRHAKGCWTELCSHCSCRGRCWMWWTHHRLPLWWPPLPAARPSSQTMCATTSCSMGAGSCLWRPPRHWSTSSTHRSKLAVSAAFVLWTGGTTFLPVY